MYWKGNRSYRDGDVKTLTKDELELGYRTSVIAKKTILY